MSDRPSQDAVARPGTAHAKAEVPQARVITESHHPDGTASTVVRAGDFVASSVTGGGQQRQDFQGRPSQGEQDVLQVCRSLRFALEREGEVWGRFGQPRGRPDDVDAVARNAAGDRLQVQVTRIERAAWEVLGRHGQATLQRGPEELAAAIRAALESKGDPSPQRRGGIPARQRSEILLALDAISSPAYADEAVVAAFLAGHREWAAGLGFRAVWLVGPTVALTRRLC
jgi:hypothetical protein